MNDLDKAALLGARPFIPGSNSFPFQSPQTGKERLQTKMLSPGTVTGSESVLVLCQNLGQVKSQMSPPGQMGT